MTTYRKLNLYKWLEENPVNFFTAEMAIGTALSMPSAYQVLQWTRTGKLEQHMPARPSGHTWLTLYEKPARVLYGAGKILAGNDGQSFQSGRVLFRTARSMERRIKNYPDDVRDWCKKCTPEQFQKIVRITKKFTRRCFHILMQEVEEELADSSKKQQDVGLMLAQSPELYSYARLTLPSMFLYQKTPQQLRNEARAHNPSSIEQLLRLDSEMINEPSIRSWVYEASGPTRETRRQCIHKWAREGFNGRWDFGTFRKSMAGMISALSEKMNFRITPSGLASSRLTPQAIQDLFIAIDQDRNTYGTFEYGYPCAFSDNYEIASFSREILRTRQPWINYWFPTPDKSLS